MVLLILSVFNISLNGILEFYRRIHIPSPYDSSRTILDESSSQAFLWFGDRISSNVTFLLPADVQPLGVLPLFRASDLPLLRRIPLVVWLCDDLEEGARSAQLMSNQVSPPENEEAEVFVMIPAIANMEGC